MTEHCKDCRWWAITSIMDDGSLGICKHDHPRKMAFSTYGTIWIHTAKDYGCVQFEPKK